MEGALLVGMFSAGPMLLMLAFFASHFHGLAGPAALDQAQLARNIASGRGFVTDIVTPLSLQRFRNVSHHPDTVNAPLGPLFLALAFRIASPSDTTAAMLTVILWLFVVGLTWLFAWRAFGPGASALAAILVCINTTMLSAAISGAPHMLATLLCTLLLYAMYELGTASVRASWLPRWLPPVAVPAALWGIIFALGCLTLPLACLLLPGLLVYVWLWPKERRVRSITCVVAAFVAVLPWLLRNTIVCGNPLFTLRWSDLIMFTESFGSDTLLQSYAPAPSPLVFCLTHPGEMLTKIVTAMGSLRDALFATADFYVGAVFVVAAFVRLGDERLERLRLAVYVMMGTMAIGVAATRPEAGAFLQFVPFVITIASGAFLQQLWRMHLRFRISPYRRVHSETMRWLIVVLAVVLLLYPLAMTFQRAKWTVPPDREPLKPAEGHIPEGEPVVTDMPWDVAWHLDRTAILAPRTEDEFRQMVSAAGSINYAVLSSPLRSDPLGEQDLFWLALADPAPVPAYGYELSKTFEPRPGLRIVIRRHTQER